MGSQESVLIATGMKCTVGYFEGKLHFQKEKDYQIAEKIGISDDQKVYKMDDLVFKQ